MPQEHEKTSNKIKNRILPIYASHKHFNFGSACRICLKGPSSLPLCCWMCWCCSLRSKRPAWNELEVVIFIDLLQFRNPRKSMNNVRWSSMLFCQSKLWNEADRRTSCKETQLVSVASSRPFKILMVHKSRKIIKASSLSPPEQSRLDAEGT